MNDADRIEEVMYLVSDAIRFGRGEYAEEDLRETIRRCLLAMDIEASAENVAIVMAD